MDIMFFSNKSIIFIAEYIKDFIFRTLGEKRKITYWNNSLCISSKYYDISIESSLNYEGIDIWQVLKEVCQNYYINVNTSICVEIYSKTFLEGFNNAKNLVKELIYLFPKDFLVIDDTGLQIFKKNDNGVQGEL